MIAIPIDLRYRFVYISSMDIQDNTSFLIAAGFTQKAIADYIGCSQPTISDVAQGKVGKKRPSYGVVTGLQKMRTLVESGDLTPASLAASNSTPSASEVA